MSGYNGRRGHPANMSQLLRDLNRIPEPAPQPDDNLPSLEEELAMFTNTTFVDWDAATPHANTHDTHCSSTSPTERVSDSLGAGELSNFDFTLPGDFNGFDFHNYPAPNVNSFSDNLGTLAPIQPSSTYPPNGAQGPYAAAMHPADKIAPEAVPRRRQLSFEEQSRLAAEEDKRRRNTAASARFRVKKKQREQALEKREKELSDKVSALESRISSLETENKWLRELVMEKNGGNDTIVSALLDRAKPAAATAPTASTASEPAAQTAAETKTEASA
ncbi:hypothetical protein F5Y17DRAFT_436436 [Xylariaceae sp. FL0594]|nr:hypothetical protein F5Y17DRAFT_436436 [Xylariaceae sp. FL0594]